MLKQKTACVTGATRGIGLAIARVLAESGYAVVGVGRRSSAEGKKIVGTLPGRGHRYVSADVGARSGRQRIFRSLERGRIDVLVNNAGVAPLERKDILETAETSYDRVMAINLKGPFFLTQWVARRMRDQALSGAGTEPSIINISSVSAYTSSTNRPEYCLSKSGVSMMTELFADRLAEYGIRVYEIRPGIVATDMTAPVKEKYDRLIRDGTLLPLRRWGRPEDVAAAVRAIVTGAFPYSTGQVFDVDGGFHIRRL